MDNDSQNEAQENTEDQNEEVNEIDDEEDWIKFQEEAKKDNSLETKSKETFPVHCPYFPGVSSEFKHYKVIIFMVRSFSSLPSNNSIFLASFFYRELIVFKMDDRDIKTCSITRMQFGHG